MVSKSWGQIKALKDGLVSDYNTILATIRTEESDPSLQDIDSFKFGDNRPDNTGQTRMRMQPSRIEWEPITQSSLDVAQFVDIGIFFGITEDEDVIMRHKCFYYDALIKYLIDNFDLGGAVQIVDPESADYETGGEMQRAALRMRIIIQNEWRYC